jgi:hypothetical protein
VAEESNNRPGRRMLIVETIAKIRRAHLVQGKAIKTIVRELRVSRKVVRKVLRSGTTEFTYERQEQPHPKLGPFIGRLEGLLVENAARPRRERLTLKRLFDLLRGEGYEGGYDAVRRFAGRWRREQQGVGGAAFARTIGIARLQVEAGERVQGLLLAPEEQLRLVGFVGVQADERAALEGDLAGDARPLADLLEQAVRQRPGAVPGPALEQPKERR